MSEVLAAIWDSLEPVQTNILSLVFALIAAGLISLFRPRVKLVYGRANNSLNYINAPDPTAENRDHRVEIYTEKFFLQNIGRKPATGVEFVLSDFPSDVSVFEPRDIDLKRLSRGECSVGIPNIAPRELVVIDCAYTIRSLQGSSQLSVPRAWGAQLNSGRCADFLTSLIWAQRSSWFSG